MRISLPLPFYFLIVEDSAQRSPILRLQTVVDVFSISILLANGKKKTISKKQESVAVVC